MNDRTRGELTKSADEMSPLLLELGERLRMLRARRGMTRKELSQASRVSDRYLVNLEFGRANPSLVVLDQIAIGLGCSIAELLGDFTTTSPEWLFLRDLLKDRSESELRKARQLFGRSIGKEGEPSHAARRVALIGLRGAGKSTLGHLLSQDLGMPLVELSALIATMAGHSIQEIHELYGSNAYRRYEHRALVEVLEDRSEFVIAAPGGIVSAPATFSLLLSQCCTVWLRAKAEDHMDRVSLQGDLRPMAGNAEAMEDLQRILSGRESFYAQAHVTINTSGQAIEETFGLLRTAVRGRLEAAS